MASVNKVILVGNLGRDPEVRYTPDGAAITLLAVATTSSWKDKNTGERRDETEWHRVVFYGRLAEVAGEYLRKGRPVYVEGRIKTRKWQDKDSGQDRYATEIIGEQMQMLGGRDDNAYDDGGFSSPTPASNTQQPRTTQRSRPATPPSFADMDDDIPF